MTLEQKRERAARLEFVLEESDGSRAFARDVRQVSVLEGPTICVPSGKKVRKAIANGGKKLRKLTLLHISDTHGKLDMVQLPAADVLVHSGDFSDPDVEQSVEALTRFNTWLGLQDQCRHKIVVAGNHELSTMGMKRGEIAGYLNNAIYLQDEAVTVENIRFYGSPWTYCHSMAFGVSSYEQMESHFERIDKRTDVLVTHQPPFLVFDRAWVGHRRGTHGLCELCGHKHVTSMHWGCPVLARQVYRVKPKLHLFGHVHDETGITLDEHTIYSNAAYDLKMAVHRFTVLVAG